VLGEEAVQPQLWAGERRVVGTQPVQRDHDRQGHVVGPRRQDQRPADLDAAPRRTGERVLHDRTGLDVGDDAVLAVEAQVLLEEGPSGQHALLDADACTDQARGCDACAPEQERTAARHARQCACG
jgi:hypothetical protein